MKEFRIKALVLAVATVSLCIAGCGGSEQDEAASSRVNVSGLGLDGYLARSKVFQDVNQNGIKNVSEASAFTDDDGYYSYNPLTNINYCALPASDSLREKHCLEALSGIYPIVVSGGYDLSTGEPFFGSMRRQVNVNSGREPTDIDVISPVTTLLSYVTEEEQTSIKTKLGITDDDLNRDYLNRSATQIEQADDIAKDKTLIRITQQLQKPIAAASKIAEITFEVGEEVDLPSDTTSFFYDAIAQELADAGNVSLDSVMSSDTVLGTALTQAKTAIETAFGDAGLPVPGGAGSLDPTLLDADSLENMSKISGIIDTLIDSLPDSVPTIALTRSSAKAIEVTVEKVAAQKPTAEIDAVAATLGDATERATLLTELDKESTNISTLTNVDISDSTEVSAVTQIDYDAVFTNLGGKRLLAGESSVSQNEDMSAILYFAAESESATKGTLLACVRFVDGLDGNELKSGGTLGTYSDVGTWSQLNSGYALLLDFEVAGLKRQATIQYSGTNEAGDHIYRTDIGDEFNTWTGPEAPAAYTGTVPTDDATCKAELDSVDPMDQSLITALGSS